MIGVQPDGDFYQFSTTFIRVFNDRKSLYFSGLRHVTNFATVSDIKNSTGGISNRS